MDSFDNINRANMYDPRWCRSFYLLFPCFLFSPVRECRYALFSLRKDWSRKATPVVAVKFPSLPDKRRQSVTSQLNSASPLGKRPLCLLHGKCSAEFPPRNKGSSASCHSRRKNLQSTLKKLFLGGIYNPFWFHVASLYIGFSMAPDQEKGSSKGTCKKEKKKKTEPRG